MAIDKAVDSAVLDAGLTATANAIRGKTGNSALIEWKNADGFKSAVDAIQTGGGGGFPNGAEWTRSNITEAMYDIEYYNGIWVATGQSGIYYSRDGKNWILCENFAGGNSGCIAGGGGMFIAGNNSGTYYSYDGITWNLSNLNRAPRLKPIRFKGKWIVTTVLNGTYYSDDGITWTKSNFTGYFGSLNAFDGVLLGSAISDNSNYYSLDGMTWTKCNPSNTNFKFIGYEDGVFVCISASSSYRGDSSGIYYSTDGITWTQSNITSGDNNYEAPFKYKNMWIACLYNGGIYYSEDGMTWSQSNIMGSGLPGPHCLYKDIAVVCYDSTARYSTDGIVWHTYEYGFNDGLSKIHRYVYYDNGRLFLTGAGQVFYSDNGIVANKAIFTNCSPSAAYHMFKMKYFDGILVAINNNEGIFYSQVWSPS